jgi:hypothetical protein
MAIGYDAPEEGQADKTGNHTVWLKSRSDGRWYSPKVVSGVPRVQRTPEHVAALSGWFTERRDLPRSRRAK